MKNKIYNNENIELVINKFKRQTLTKTEWTHEVHLITAIWFIKNYDYFDAVCRLKSGIILLNTANQKDNTSSSGYHETITIFWTKVIAAYIKSANTILLDELVNNFLESPLADHYLPYEFYDKKQLMAADRRAIYSDGDLQKVNEVNVKKLLNG